MGVLLNILVQIDKFANFQVKTGSIRNAKTNGEAIQLYDPAFAVLCLTRSLGALRAPTSRLRPFGPA